MRTRPQESGALSIVALFYNYSIYFTFFLFFPPETVASASARWSATLRSLTAPLSSCASDSSRYRTRTACTCATSAASSPSQTCVLEATSAKGAKTRHKYVYPYTVLSNASGNTFVQSASIRTYCTLYMYCKPVLCRKHKRIKTVIR